MSQSKNPHGTCKLLGVFVARYVDENCGDQVSGYLGLHLLKTVTNDGAGIPQKKNMII